MTAEDGNQRGCYECVYTYSAMGYSVCVCVFGNHASGKHIQTHKTHTL